MRPSAGRGLTGSTLPPTRARSSATTPNGTISRPPLRRRAKRSCANWMSNTAPMGPVYINLDAEMQENKLTDQLPPIDVRRFQPLTVTAADPELVREAAKLLKSAKSPVILMGRVSRSLEGWNERVALAEALNAK